MSSARVLVVDDDPWILRMVSATLEKRSYVVDTARDGKQALARAQSNPPDVIVTDVMMPVMDGWSFVQQLRAIPHLAPIPVIFLTALGKDEARLRSLGLTPNDFLSKPFRFEELDRRVSTALERRNEQSSPGMPQPPGDGSSMPGYPPQQPGYPSQQPGYPGYQQPGYPPGYPQQGYPQQGYPGQQPGYPGHGQQGYPAQPGYPPQGYPGQQPGYPPQGYPSQQPGYPQGLPPPAAPPAGNPQGGATQPLPVPGSGGDAGQKRTTALNGRLEQLGLSSLLVMMEMERKDGVLSLKDSQTSQVGRIFLRKGQVICARIDKRSELGGKESVYEMLAWQKGTFSFNAMEVQMEDTVKSSTTHLLMEGARLIDETNR